MASTLFVQSDESATRRRSGRDAKGCAAARLNLDDCANVAESRRLSMEVLEFCRLVGSASSVPGGIGVCANSSELAAIDDQIVVADRLARPLHDAGNHGRLER